jgi:hypothetical protein
LLPYPDEHVCAVLDQGNEADLRKGAAAAAALDLLAPARREGHTFFVQKSDG